MDATDLQLLCDYNYWAHKRILSFALQLDAGQYREPNLYPMRSMHGTLVHMLGAEWNWLRRIRDGASERAMLNEHEFSSLEDVQARWADVEQQYRAYLKSISNDDLARIVRYTTMTGAAYSNLLWQLLLHVALHGVQHRGECAQMLTDFGHSPGNLDLSAFLREP